MRVRCSQAFRLLSGRRMCQCIFFLYELEGAVTVQASAENVRYVTTMMQGVGLQTDWLVSLSSDETGWWFMLVILPKCQEKMFGVIAKNWWVVTWNLTSTFWHGASPSASYVGNSQNFFERSTPTCHQTVSGPNSALNMRVLDLVILSWFPSQCSTLQGHFCNSHVLHTVHSVFFSKTLFDFKKSISGLIELKFSEKTPNEVLYAPICFWGVSF